MGADAVEGCCYIEAICTLHIVLEVTVSVNPPPVAFDSTQKMAGLDFKN